MFESVADLKKSAMYKRVKDLHGLSKAKLVKFATVFAAVWDRVLRNGGTEAQAEAAGLAIALSAAKRHAEPAMVATLEDSRHYFAPAARELLGRNGAGGIEGAEYSYEYLAKNMDLMKVISAGSEFNWSHSHKEGLGVIHDIILASEAPEDIRAKMDKDTPFIYVASYFKDTAEEARNEIGISLEWSSFKAADGKSEVIPFTFAVSDVPLNGPEAGIKKIADAPKVQMVEGTGVTMETTGGGDGGTYTVTVSSNTTNSTATNAYIVADRSSKTEADLMSTELLAQLQTKVASLETDLANAQKARAESEQKAASLKEVTEKALKIVEELKLAAVDKEADEFAASLVKDGKVATDGTAKFVELYKSNPTLAKELAAALPKAHVGESAAKAQPLSKESQAALEADMKKLGKLLLG